MGHPLPLQDPTTDIGNCVMVPITWLQHAIELLLEHGESGPTIQKLNQRASAWQSHKAPGQRLVKLSEQRAEFEAAHPVPDVVFWAEAERTYLAVRDCPEQHAAANQMNALYAGFLLRARTPEGL